MRSFLLPKKSDSNLALLGPINDRSVSSQESTEVKGSLATLAREMAKQQMMRDQQREMEGAQDTINVKAPSLLNRLVETRRLLDEAFKTLSNAAARKIDVSPAGDWLLDNYHVVKEHITEIKRSMPKNYYAELPKLSAGPWAGYPRVYEMTMHLISGTEGVVDVEVANMFISEFKRTHLRMGELWAFPIMLRLGLIGNIWRMTKRALDRLADIEAADKWAEELTQKGTLGNLAVLRFMTERPQLTPTFVTRIFTRTRSYQSGSSSPLYWLEKYMTEEGVDAEECSRQETLQLSLTRSVMANSITSLKKISQGDWLSFFEAHSETDRILRTDPSGHYSLMNFETRDRYRHVVEGFALSTSLLEEVVAQTAINLARAALDEFLEAHQIPDPTLAQSTDGEEKEPSGHALPEGLEYPVTAHVGYWLAGDGRKLLEEECGYKRPLVYTLYLGLKRYPHLFFFSTIIFLTWLIMLWLYAILPDGLNFLQYSLAMLCLFMLANDTAIGLMNQLVTRAFPPLLLPMLDFVKRPVPSECKTIVVVPTLFPSLAAVESAMEQLEVHYLANRDSNILFAVLSDFTDAPKQNMPGDETLLKAAKKGCKELNRRHGDGAFFLFHRPRLFNPQQGQKGVWMGWERKRGKLVQFNQFLLDLNQGKTDKSNFLTIVGDLSLLEGTRYVMTLDADTVLPRDAAKQMISMIAHPLNHAVLDEKHHRVVSGYGIIQPRVTTMITSRASKFATINSGKPGVDPYTTAVSDVYQDLFAEGSYTGKGIYDLKAFAASTEGRFQDNTILSHDLIEGSYARAGLATNIEVFDDYPSHYLAYSKRKHRWIRGDWQLLRWGVGFMATFSRQKKERIKLSAISRWKIFDNLRRSVVEIDQYLFFLLIWLVFPISWFVPGTCLAIGFLVFPWVFSFTMSVISPPSDGETSLRAYYHEVFLDGYNSVIQFLVSLTFMPHQSLIVLDAIIRTLCRLVTRRNLLEWVTASQVESMLQKNAKAAWLQMWDAVTLSSVVTLIVLMRMTCTFQLDETCEPASLFSFFFAVPILALWIAAPSIANALSTTQQQQTKEELSPSDRKSALRYALLHWRFYDSFATADSKWLPPDNFQEDPSPVIAMRTSPTNIGMYLLSIVSAYDLGFITAGRLVDLIEKTFSSLDRMPRFRGHFYNWYDLNYLSVLNPPYVSTVDSGNLAGSFLALKQAFLSIGNEPVWPEARYKDALVGALSIVLKLLGMGGDVDRDGDPYERDTRKDLVKFVHRVLVALQNATEGQLRGMLRSCSQDLAQPLDMVKGQEASPVFREVQYWIQWSIDLINLLLNDELLAHHHSIKGGSSSFSHLAATSPSAAALISKLRKLSQRAEAFAMDMDFTFLFDRQHKLFSIGFNTATNEADRSLYDLLASESRLASYIAVAKNDVPVEHWFRLGRSLVGCGALVSWSGTMFEYLMPLILMESFPNTLLNRTNHAVIQAQIAYTARVHSGSPHVPWGISESAYNFRNREGTYQYRAFGVPDLALKRGQGKDYVVAPYASMLALHVKPAVAMENLALLESIGSLGPYGFRDSVDYTRPAAYAELAIVGNYMAHHIGMGLATLDNVLNGSIWVKRFHADTLVSSAKLLLHERVPRQVSLVQAAVSESGFERQPAVKPGDDQVVVREFTTADTCQPRVGLLGMLPYTILVTNAGGGYSYWGDLAVTRWFNDCTMDNTGQWIYIKDLTSKRKWSAAHQPICAPADEYKVTFAVDCIVFQRKDGPILSSTKIAINTNHQAEVRCLTLTNTGDEPHEIEVTSYGEIVLQPPAADRAHPAFGNLFIETEWIENINAILAYRRPRSAGNTIPYLVHVIALSGNAQTIGKIQYETDRSRFVGRGRSTRNPVALDDGFELSGRVGAVLDPIFSIRVTVVVPPGQAVSVSYTNIVSDQKQQLLNRADLYSDISAARRTFEISSSQMQEELHDLNITAEDAMLFQMLVGHMLYRQQAFASSHKLTRNRLGREGLWAHGISGDWPICLVLIDGEKGLKAFRQTLQAHRYWRQKGVIIDIVVVNTQPPTYLQDLQDQLLGAVTSSSSAKLIDKPGGIFLRRKEMLPPENFFLLQAISRVHIHCGMGALTMNKFDVPDEFFNYQPPFEPLTVDGLVVEPPRTPASPLPRRNVSHSHISSLSEKEREKEKHNLLLRQKEKENEKPLPPLQDWNGYGGFTEEGYYEIRLTDDKVPPAPWANVVANASAGFLVTETGGGFSWAQSSFFFRLTPWTNDPVSDRPGEVLYIRDDMDGEIWSCTPAPIRHSSLYRVIHKQGATSFEHEHKGIATKLTMAMAEGEDLKIAVLEMRNTSPRRRRLTLASYVEWALGQQREHTQHQIYTFVDNATQALCARNCFDSHFAQFMAFSWASEPTSGFTCDRREFIGRNGTLERPAGLCRVALSEVVGAGHDPCAVKQMSIELASGERKKIVVLLGVAKDAAQMQEMLRKYGKVAAYERAVQKSLDNWKERLSVVQIKTPSNSFDTMLNHWALYQAWACRVWGRSGFYQSSGAFGFRDQLQDVMALVYSDPKIARNQITLSASRQFKEGDVQHWWHPHNGQGIRSRISDDLVWLPYVVDHYVMVTGDIGVLDEVIPFLQMRQLNENEDDIYDQPHASDDRGTVYEHCIRAIKRASTSGVHDLPLIGSGDWNDGMNKVGAGGKGESVWLAWFLVATMNRFIHYARVRGDTANFEYLTNRAASYKLAAERAWDGAWYRRAYFDDGTPLGSSTCEECKIDSLAQSWSIISGAGDPQKLDLVLEALDKHLVHDEGRLIMLLTPAFDKTDHNPGYIKGYLPGVRENGAQYTHAAVWVVLANCLAGRGQRAFDLFQLINPVTHGDSEKTIEQYKTEPYVLCGDVYTAAGNVGRGGWSWYTGSASWLYRTGVEAILGLHKYSDRLEFNPCIPPEWDTYEMVYRLNDHVRYHITINNPDHVSTGVVSVRVDDQEQSDFCVHFPSEEKSSSSSTSSSIENHEENNKKEKEKEDAPKAAEIKIVVEPAEDEKGKERIKDNEDEPAVVSKEEVEKKKQQEKEKEKEKEKEREDEKEKEKEVVLAVTQKEIKVVVVMGRVEHQQHHHH